MTRARLSHDDALTLWRARDVARVQSVLHGLLLLFFVGEFLVYCLLGYWYLAVPLMAVQLAALWCLRWGLRWLRRMAHQVLWRTIDAIRDAGHRAHHTHMR